MIQFGCNNDNSAHSLHTIPRWSASRMKSLLLSPLPPSTQEMLAQIYARVCSKSLTSPSNKKDEYSACKSLTSKVSFIVYGYQTTFYRNTNTNCFEQRFCNTVKLMIYQLSLFEGKLELFLQAYAVGQV